MPRARWTAALVALITATTAIVVSSVSSAAATTPIRAAFVYEWFPEGENWASQYTPSLGKYDSSNSTILAAQIGEAKYAGLDAFISSWWGQGTPTDTRLPLLLNAARAQGFHVTPYYEPEGQSPPPSDAQVASDFTYLAGMSTDPAWLTVAGKPVLFVYNTGTEGSCAGVARLEAANAGRFYLNAKVFGGYRTCSVQPESWHQYGPAVGYDQQGIYSATVSPGFWKFNEATPRLARDVTRFKSDLARQIASGAQWQLTTTWSEWGEGTAVEPATAWPSPSGMGVYLDAMHDAYAGTQPPPTTSSSTVASTTAVSSTDTSTALSTTIDTTTQTTTPTTATETSTPTTSSGTATTPPTTTTPPPTGVTKILTFIEENHSLAQMQAGMPYLYSQATTYGYATNYTAIRHPSLPNYLAIAGGSTFGVTDDAAPSSHPIAGSSVFGAAITAGKAAKSYQEGMTSTCMASNTGRYAVKHNPWAYFTAEHTQCQAFDVPSGTVTAGALRTDVVNGTLPNVGEVTPDLCNDAHDCSLATADTWLKNWLTLIYASPDWQSGNLAVIVLADEDNNTSGNKVLTVVIHPSQSHRVVSTALTHYSLTGLLTRVTGAPCINAGCTAADMASAFALPIG